MQADSPLNRFAQGRPPLLAVRWPVRRVLPLTSQVTLVLHFSGFSVAAVLFTGANGHCQRPFIPTETNRLYFPPRSGLFCHDGLTSIWPCLCTSTR